MATAPRPGRKGGKIEGSPALAPSTSSGKTPPSEIKIAREASEGFVSERTSSALFENSSLLAFDPEAINHIGKGVVLGGTKQVRTEVRAATVAKEQVHAKFEVFLSLQQAGKANSLPVLNLKKEFESCDVAVATYDEGIHFIASEVADDESGAVALVIVPSYFNVEKTAHLFEKITPNGANVVLQWVGACLTPAEVAPHARLFVADAKTALQYFVSNADTDMRPFTHVVFPKIRCHQPVAQLALAALKKTASKAKILIAGGTIAEDNARFRQYLAPREVYFSPSVSASPPNDIEFITHEEACALVESSVVSVAVDRTGKFPGPHHKLVEHSLQVCIQLIEKIIKSSKVPQTIVVFTADVGDALMTIAKNASIGEFLIQRDDLVASTDNVPSSPMAKVDGDHKIHVFHHCDLDEALTLGATVVIDKGTMKVSWVPSPSESTFPCKRTEWESVGECETRKRALGWNSNGLYVALYPQEAAEVFPKETPLHLELIDMEGALTQCSRAKAAVTPQHLQTAFPNESIMRAMIELAEAGAIVSQTDLGFTFAGEIFSRLPTLTDCSALVLLGLMMGLGEATIAIAAVSTIHVFAHKNSAAQSNTEWFDHVAAQRHAAAGDLSKSSDVLADAMILLKWMRLAALGEADMNAYVATLQVPLMRLENIATLVRHLREDLADYAILESFSSATTVERVIKSLEHNWDALSLMLATAMCRKAIVVRQDGSLSARDISGNMLFLRTSKIAAPNTYFPSSVPWRVGNAIIGASIQNSHNTIYAKDLTAVKNTYLLASLLLLYPRVEYSAPQATDSGTFVYFTVVANSQMKRLKVSIGDAARILEFRDKLNKSYGSMMAFRSLPRTSTLSQITQYLQTNDRTFNLRQIQKELQTELVSLAEEIGIVEDNKSFPQVKPHRLIPTELGGQILAVALPSDEEIFKAVKERKFPAVDALSIQPSVASLPAPSPSIVVMHKEPSAIVTAAPMFVEDDDVETEDNYFARHGPMIEDDDE